MELRRVCRDEKGSTRWLEQAVGRIEAMSNRFATDASAVSNEVWEGIAKRSPLLGLWISLDGEEVIGHLLARIQPWDGQWVVWIVQAETDRAVTRQFGDLVHRALDEWAHHFNTTYGKDGIHVSEVLMLSPRMTEAWTRHSGFEPYRWLFKRRVRKS